MTDTRQTDYPDEMSPGEQETLRTIVRHMIPASARLSVPGADDPEIFADIVRSVGRDKGELARALRAVNAAAQGRLLDLSPVQQSVLLEQFRADEPGLSGVLEAVTVRCYYRDDRVLKAIGMEPRAPFPRGYQIEQGDWSLLEPVRRRGKKYRDMA